MLDWSARLDDLMDFLKREYAVEDRQAVEILLAAGPLNCPRTPTVWMILEVPWYARECRDGWFSFGEQWLPYSLAQLRVRSPWRLVETRMNEWLEAPNEERLFIEPDYDRYPMFHRLTQARDLLQRALRLRVPTERVAIPLRAIDQRAKDRRADELAALAGRVLEDRVGARPQDPPVFHQPPNFLYHLELVERLSPWFRDWNLLVEAFAALAVRRAYLEARTETGPEEIRALARVAADSVPPWISKAVRTLLEGPAAALRLERMMGLEEKSRRSGHGAHRELVRLHRSGIIRWNPQRMHWAIVEEHRHGLADVIQGRAFGRERAAAT
jgi:hypothetical protein